MTAKTKKPTDQAAKFRKLARQAECDPNEDRYADTLKRVAGAPLPAKGTEPAKKDEA